MNCRNLFSPYVVSCQILLRTYVRMYICILPLLSLEGSEYEEKTTIQFSPLYVCPLCVHARMCVPALHPCLLPQYPSPLLSPPCVQAAQCVQYLQRPVFASSLAWDLLAEVLVEEELPEILKELRGEQQHCAGWVCGVAVLRHMLAGQCRALGAVTSSAGYSCQLRGCIARAVYSVCTCSGGCC